MYKFGDVEADVLHVTVYCAWFVMTTKQLLYVEILKDAFSMWRIVAMYVTWTFFLFITLC